MRLVKLFSSDDGENFYDVLMTADEISLFSEACEKIFGEYLTDGPSRYDMTDRMKGMKDSDILAERLRSNAGSYGRAAVSGGIGAGIGAGVGALAAGIAKVRGVKNVSVKKAMKLGAGAGAAIGGGGKLLATHQERSDNRFHNNRLQYMQALARRREMKDWLNNAVNREGYTY